MNKKNRQRYYILLILTDGDAEDMEQTKEEIVKASKLPISIVIVGLGSNSFEKMIELDADDPIHKIRGKFSGEESERDIVQFVPFREFRDKAGLLEDETLKEIPTQFMQFMTEKKIKPKGNKVVANDQSPEARLKQYDPNKLAVATPVIKSENHYFRKKESKMIQDLIKMGFPEEAVKDMISKGLPSDNKLLAIDILISNGVMLKRSETIKNAGDKSRVNEEKAKKEAQEKGLCLECKGHRAKYAAMPCKHVIFCMKCSEKAKDKNCAICGKDVLKAVRVYNPDQ